ncbi:hypothetical protein GALMADRAFT_120430 [Galerina marginata CBS 339.88]|uniref:Carboxylic ester hydrolase n=1 Tax=Galerina marginata (strain CBS 339.88) TaxID=685588 RepID=A0A067T4J6_GALM3|nr:hypothetical protein GALMADRAFT_120430 [Galerina marginata CBS 339.88]
MTLPFAMLQTLKILSLAILVGAQASPTPSANLTVKLSYGSFQGNATGNVVEFLGMPFAAPPVGDLRFAPPRPPAPFTGVRQATSFGAACFQQAINATALSAPLGDIGSAIAKGIAGFTNVSEDCLFINVIKPANLTAGKSVPVLFWMYGGGFVDGDTSANPGNSVVARSIALNEPVIYVSANYRLNALGFLGGKEAKAAGLGNAGLRDQRFAMQWVQDNIAAFGGDPTKVTIWGESAGAVSVGLHLVLNNGNPGGLFRGAVMESGSPFPLSDITAQQPLFDQLVNNTGCTGSRDPISCLRAVTFQNISSAINLSPNIFSFTSLQRSSSWNPSVDGQFITRSPIESLQKGLYARVPIISGDCDDEGTLFSLSNLNITTNAEFLAYMHSNYLVPNDQLAALGQAYPDNVTQGSPYGTQNQSALSPQFKRLAAIQGDLQFQGPRRFFLKIASKTQKTFAFLFKRGKTTPVLGAFHSSDIAEFYGVESNINATSPDFIGTDALVNFANTGDPNLPNNSMSLLSAMNWPAWTASTSPPLLTFIDPAPNVTITFDTYRVDAMNLLTNISFAIPSNNN